MIDLHIHSNYSDDGEFTPSELVRQCARAGVTVMSVADHNCVRANAEAKALAEQLGIRYISGIEIDCALEGVNFHLLGYHIDFESPDFAAIEENVARQERDASRERLRKIRELGFSVTEEELDRVGNPVWIGEVFAEVLLGKPEYKDHPLLLPYRENGPRGDNPYVNFYWDVCSQGKPCYAPVNYPSMEEAINVIHRNGGKAVLAHPGVNLKGHGEVLAKVLSLEIDGIEAFSSYHTPEEIEFYRETAQKHGLLVTCGSDYHGKIKPAVRLGGYGTLPPDFELGL